MIQDSRLARDPFSTPRQFSDLTVFPLSVLSLLSSLSPLSLPQLTQLLDQNTNQLSLRQCTSFNSKYSSSLPLSFSPPRSITMSGPPHDTWPKEGDTFAHWSDLLLATQLAALRSGYTGIGKRWEVSVPDKVSIRCHVEPCAGREDRCITTLIRARASNPEALTGTWVVDLVRTEYLDVRQHSRHVGGGIGITEGFVVSLFRFRLDGSADTACSIAVCPDEAPQITSRPAHQGLEVDAPSRSCPPLRSSSKREVHNRLLPTLRCRIQMFAILCMRSQRSV